MMNKVYLGWIRAANGLIKSRPRKLIANAVTSFGGRGIADPRDGLGNTTPHVLYEYQ